MAEVKKRGRPAKLKQAELGISKLLLLTNVPANPATRKLQKNKGGQTPWKIKHLK